MYKWRGDTRWRLAHVPGEVEHQGEHVVVLPLGERRAAPGRGPGSAGGWDVRAERSIGFGSRTSRRVHVGQRSRAGPPPAGWSARAGVPPSTSPAGGDAGGVHPDGGAVQEPPAGRPHVSGSSHAGRRAGPARRPPPAPPRPAAGPSVVPHQHPHVAGQVRHVLAELVHPQVGSRRSGRSSRARPAPRRPESSSRWEVNRSGPRTTNAPSRANCTHSRQRYGRNRRSRSDGGGSADGTDGTQ